jgi:hypothetical protein
MVGDTKRPPPSVGLTGASVLMIISGVMQPKPSGMRPQTQVLVSHWSCKGCSLTGEIVPHMDLDGPPWRLTEDITAILREHARRTPKGEYHGAFIEVAY